ncbi:MAG TPA: DUF3152 domain-containing protein [Acidimicrobiales bacterium]|nr:DUF3152 domain-containing protein [Acidimicrobiales bacterium]
MAGSGRPDAKEVHSTTAIEGNTLTEEQVREHLLGELRPPSRCRRFLTVVALSVAALLASAACSDAPDGERSATPSSAPGAPSSRPALAADGTPTSVAPTSHPTTPSPTSTSLQVRPAPARSSPRATPSPPPTPDVVEVAYRLERRTSDAQTASFEEVVEATLTDARGWSRAGFRLVRRDDAAFLVVLAEGPEVDQLCLPRDTYGLYSCQRGPVVALNADRWRQATPKWTGDLATYRQMLVNHEVGHLLGQHHPARQCPARGRPAPVMAQQSTELNGCLPNPRPLEHEIAYAARHEEPLAPP